MNIQRLQDETDEAFANRIVEEATAQATAANETAATARQTEYSELSTLLTDAGVAEAPTLTERCRALMAEARDGRAYRSSLIEDTLKQGVRAHGESFQQDVYRKMLNTSDIDSIKRMHEDLKAVGDKLFPAGRASNDEVTEGTTKKPKNPDDAYKVR